MDSVLIVDALARGSLGRRVVTVDAIGAGPRTVAGVLESLGIDVDLRVAEDVARDPSILEKFDILLVSAMSVDAATVERLVKLWRRRRGRAPVIVGGPAALEEGFAARVGADLAVHGEAEPVIEKLFLEEAVAPGGVDAEKLATMCGVEYRLDGRVVRRPRCPLMPRRRWERYRPSTRLITRYPGYWAARVYVEAVRGCSNYNFPRLEEILPPSLLPEKPRPGCAYCSVVSLWGYARSRSIDLIYDEVKSLIEHGVRRIVLSGPDILDYGRDWLVEPKPLVDPRSPPPNTRALRSLLSRLTSIPEVSAGEAGVMAENVKPSLVTEEAAATLGDYLAGTPIHIGVETGDDRLLRILGRPATLRETLEAVERLVRHRLRVYAYIIYCLPGETPRTIEKTMALMRRLYNIGVEKITAYKFMPIPDSALEKLAEKPPRCPENHPIKKLAETLNRKAKKRLVGAKVKAIVAGMHPRLRRPVAYPIPHGPVIALEKGQHARVGELIEARITGVTSDRIVDAVIVRRLGIASPAGTSQ